MKSFMDLTWFDHLYFLVIAVVIPIMSVMSGNAIDELEDEDLAVINGDKKHLYYSNGLLLWIGALLVTTSWVLTPKSFTLLGIAWPKIDNRIWMYSAILLAIYAIDTAVNVYHHYKNTEEEDEKGMEVVLPHTWMEYLHFCFLAVSAGVCEEIVYRGFLINYFKEVLPTSPYALQLAILIPAVLFSLAHLYQGWFNVIKIFSISILFSNIFIYSESLLIVVLIHVLVDLISGFVALMLYKRDVKLKGIANKP